MVYREFQLERLEIMRHKWLESEKAGFDIGFEQALTGWITKHRAGWRASRTNSSRQDQENQKDQKDRESREGRDN